MRSVSGSPSAAEQAHWGSRRGVLPRGGVVTTSDRDHGATARKVDHPEEILQLLNLWSVEANSGHRSLLAGFGSAYCWNSSRIGSWIGAARRYSRIPWWFELSLTTTKSVHRSAGAEAGRRVWSSETRSRASEALRH